MSISHNDFPIAGYFGRHTLKKKKKSGKYESMYMLKNPATTRPYIISEMIGDLIQRKEEFPHLSSLIDPWLAELTSNAKNPNAVYTLCRIGDTAELADKRLKEQCWDKLERLACLLYQPLYHRNLAFGDVTISDYVTYQRQSLYTDSLPDTRSRLLGVLDKVILPVIGTIKLKDLDINAQKKLLGTIDRKLRKEGAKNSRRGYVRRAYRGLLLSIEGSGWLGCSAGLRLVDLIGMHRNRNAQIRNSVRVDHLDEGQRHALFHLLEQPNLLFEQFLVALLYSGLDAAEIAALQFSDFEVLELRDGFCFTLLVRQRLRKLHQRYSTISATNPQFPIEKFRRLSLPPWAGDVLLCWLKHLHDIGLSDNQIQKMRLSDEAPNGFISGPSEISSRIQPLLRQAGINNIEVTRTDANGHPYREQLVADIQLLSQDAQYLAQRCGADTMMLHAIFGRSWTETDEQAYADLTSDQYALSIYLHLRRWSPFPPTCLPDDNTEQLTGLSLVPANHVLKVENTTNHPLTLTLSASYAISAKWERI